MSAGPWITRLFGRGMPRAGRRPGRPNTNVGRHRLAVELLEGRLAPATLTVNSTADTANPTDPYLSLREAITLVNSPSLPDGLSGQILGQISGDLHGGGSDTIGFDTSQVTLISLAGGQLELSLPASTAAVTIDGGGVVAVDGANATRVFQVDPGVQATFAHLGIVRGYAAGSGEASLGGGVYNRGLLTLTDCNLDGNTTAGGVGGGLCNNGGTAMVDGSAVTNSAAVDGNGGGLYNSADGTLTVTDSLVRGNSGSGYGGGIYNQGGQLAVNGSTLSNNSIVASFGRPGGGICNTDSGTVAVADSVLSGNSAYNGGGIETDSGTLTLINCALRSNSAFAGGGIYSAGSTLSVTDCYFYSNSGHLTGGGIHNNSGTATVTSSAFSSNQAGIGGGIENDGTLTVIDSTFIMNGGSGGAIDNVGTLAVMNSTLSRNSGSIFNDGALFTGNGGTVTVTNCTISDNLGGGIVAGAGTVTVTNSTISSNSAIVFEHFTGGGGIYNSGTLTVTNSTISGNSATRPGGGIFNIFSGTATVTNSTINGNSAPNGGGIYNLMSTLNLQNTIVAGNTSNPDSGPDINGDVQSSSSYNLIGVGDSTLSGISDGVNQNQIGTAASPIDPGLLPLGDYGGPTYTQALLPHSRALDAGDPAQAGSLDQRGITRTGPVNIGSFQASAVILFVYAPATVTAGVPFDVRVAAFDPYGLTDFGYTGTVMLSSSDPQVGLIGSHAYTLADAGSFTFSAVELTTGPQTLTASDGTLTTTADLTVLPGAAPSHGSGPAASPRLGESSGLLLGYDGLDSLTTASLGTALVRQPDGHGPIR